MGDDLGISLAVKSVSARLQPIFDAFVILDDPVVDNGETAGAVEMRVCVFIGDSTVRGPASVTEADGSIGEFRDGVADSAGAFRDVDVSVRSYRDAPRVVSAILEFAERVQDDVAACLVRPNIAEDAAHSVIPSHR